MTIDGRPNDVVAPHHASAAPSQREAVSDLPGGGEEPIRTITVSA
ncbi:hypothetical protein [Streptomyces sp. NRRL S-350]|nr:hypothetical protein [Streptomyces sp. NRRL S-350]